MTAPERRPIQVLSPAVAERIAAGEVIERPSSVVKELVENALDAGATRIAVALGAGGKELISVTDNGHGMDPESLWLATQRHATSKLQALKDLDSLNTLGFRGEALPSIAAVSDLGIVSRTAESSSAFELELTFESAFARTQGVEPKATSFGRFLDSPHGTRIQARGLFSQVPARLKFLRSQGAEVSQVREWLERLAIARPEVAFLLESDGRRILDLDPATPAERVRAVLADGEDYPIITEESELVSLYWVQGLSLPHSRRLVQVVNGRAVRDRMLQQAMLGGFRQALLPGQFPALALSVRVDPSTVDVNVHPTKTEIRFLDNRRIFRAVDDVVASVLGRAGAPAYVPGAGAGFGSGSGSPPSGAGFTLGGGTDLAARDPAAWPTSGGRATDHWRAGVAQGQGWDFRTPPTVLTASEPGADAGGDTVRNLETEAHASPLAGARFVGVLFNTYIAHEQGDELILVDQHAADERIRYERLRRRVTGATAERHSQELLLPEAVSFSAEEARTLEQRLPWLERMGFATEVFGESSLLFRSVPAEWGTHALRTRLKSLVERVIAADSSEGSLGFDEALFERLASEACHSSVRAGDRLEDLEARALVSRLFDCAHPWNCPHGRPTVVRIPRARLEEWFQRRV